MAQLKSGISEAIAEALQATRAEHHEKLDPAPTTTTRAISDSTTSIEMLAESSSISTAGEGASALHGIDLTSAAPITCSPECPGGDNGSNGAIAAASASAAGVVSSTGVLHEEGNHLATSCFQPRDKLACVLPPTAMPATSPASLSLALVATKPAAPAVLESDPIMTLPANRYAACLDNAPDAPGAVHMQAKLIITDSSSSDVLVSMSTSLAKLEGTDTAVTLEDEQRQTCLSREQSLVFVAAQDVANNDNLVTSTSVLPLTLAVLSVNDNNISNKHDATSSRAAPMIKLIHGNRNCGMYLHPKFRFPLLVHAPWDPGEQAREMRDHIPLRDSLLMVSCLRCPPDRTQFSGASPLLHYVSGDTLSMLPWDPGDSTISLWNMRILLQRGTSYEFLAFMWNSGHVVTDGHKCITGFDFTMVLYAQDVIVTCLEQLQFQGTNKYWSIYLQFGQLQYVMGALLQLTPCPSWSIEFLALVQRLYQARVELEMRLELSMQTHIFALHCCSIVLRNMGTCSSFHNNECPWILGSGIPLSPLFLETDSFRFHLFAEGYIEIRHGLQLYAWNLAEMIYFAAILIQLSRDILLPASDYGLYFLVGCAATQYSDILQWGIAWAFKLRCIDWSFQLRQPFPLAGVSGLWDIIYAGINTLQIPWDLGACCSSQRQDNPEGPNDAGSSARNAPSQVPWDPGGSSQDRLGGKPDFKRGGIVSEPGPRPDGGLPFAGLGPAQKPKE